MHAPPPGFTPPPGPPGGFLPPLPGVAVQDARALAQGQVNGPAIGLMIVSGLCALFYVFATVMVLFAGGITFLQGGSGDPGAALGMGIGAAMYAFWAVASIVCFVGALRMKAMKNYAFAVTSAVLAILPCTTYLCCMAMMPFGIWAMIVLMKPEVKAAFG
ncbi:MAG: hypothetical protein HS104_04725 [Polyangiaceae bacterium]|nr:hypothetical protein [Polyangiaceae bacterium]MCL4751959.1 hypothetical protein [Myxococcales bacterium]